MKDLHLQYLPNGLGTLESNVYQSQVQIKEEGYRFTLSTVRHKNNESSKDR